MFLFTSVQNIDLNTFKAAVTQLEVENQKLHDALEEQKQYCEELEENKKITEESENEKRIHGEERMREAEKKLKSEMRLVRCFFLNNKHCSTYRL